MKQPVSGNGVLSLKLHTIFSLFHVGTDQLFNICRFVVLPLEVVNQI